MSECASVSFPFRERICSISFGTMANEVSDHEQVRELADRRVGILVDGDHVLRGLHPDAVLDGAGDPAADVERWFHNLASLTDLELIWDPSGVSRGAARANGATQRIGELLQELEARLAAHTRGHRPR